MALFQTDDPAGVACLLLLGGAFFIRPFVPMEYTAIDVAVTLLCGYVCLSCFAGINIWGSLQVARQVLACFLGYFIMRKIQMHPLPRQVFFTLSLAVAAAAVLLALYSFVMFWRSARSAGFEEIYSLRFLFKPLGYNTNAWAAVLLALLGFIGAAPAGRFLPVWFLRTLSGLVLLTLLLSFSRGVYLSLVVLAALWWYVDRSRSKKQEVAIACAVGALILFCFPKETFTTLRMNHTLSQRQSAEGRIHASCAAWEAWKEHPWLGVGVGNYTLATDKELTKGEMRPYTSYAPNLAAQIAVEYGVVGCLLVLFLLVCVCRRVIRRRKDKKCQVVAAALLALLVKEMTLGTLVCTPVILWIVFLLLAVFQWEEGQEEALFYWQEDRRFHYSVWTVCLLCYMTYSSFAVWHYLDEQLNTEGKEGFLKRDWVTADFCIKRTSRAVPYLVNRAISYMDVEEHWRVDSYLDPIRNSVEEARRKQPEDVHIAFLQAKWSRLAWRYEEADSLFGELVASYPNNPLYRYEWYKVLRENGRKREACIQLEEAVGLMPRLLELDSLCELRHRDSLFYQALSEKLLTWRPSPHTSADEFARRGYIAYHYGQIRQAETYLYKAVSQLPGLSTPWFLLGQIYKEAGRRKESDACLGKYRLLTYGAFTLTPIPTDSLQLPTFHERDLLKDYAIRFKDWYKSSLFLTKR